MNLRLGEEGKCHCLPDGMKIRTNSESNALLDRFFSKSREIGMIDSETSSAPTQGFLNES
jgi:hypothetical protein